MKQILLAVLAGTLLCTNACASSRANVTTVNKTSQPELIPTEAVIVEKARMPGKPFLEARKKGSSSSIGTDAIDVRTQTAWFYGQQPVVTCYNLAENFGASDKAVRQALSGAIKSWREYFAAKKIIGGDPALAPNINFKLAGKCKGDEDLVVHFGTGPIFGGLQDLKAVQKLNYPAAYVNKTHMTQDLRWGKGYVRLVAQGYYGNEEGAVFPDWRRAGALDAIVTHELGHVLGFTHVPQTIMHAELVDEAFAEHSPGARPTGPAGFVRIDQGQQLVTCADCPGRYVLVDATPGAALFTRLGLDPKLKIQIGQGPQGYSIGDGKTQLALVESSRSETAGSPHLLSNFPEKLRDRGQALNVYGYVAKGSDKFPLSLEINSNSDGAGILLRALQDGVFFEAGRFALE